MDTLSRILRQILESNTELKSGVHEARILELWGPSIGDPIARYAKAVKIQGRTLYVTVSQSVWRQELLANKRLVLDKLNAKLKEHLGAPSSGTEWVTEIFFAGGSSSSGNRTKAGKAFPKK
jgi:predicted nucleic acid-binding Zn ribbon protein